MDVGTMGRVKTTAGAACVAALAAMALASGAPGTTAATPKAKTPAAAPKSCPDADLVATPTNTSKLEAALVCEVNRYRKVRDLKKVTSRPKLAKSARSFAKKLAKARRLDHRLNGTTLRTRARAAGYKQWRNVDFENIGAGQMTAAQILAEWIADPPHRVVIVAPGRSIGVGFASGYWVMDVGRR